MSSSARSSVPSLPYRELDAVFLDLGNTLVTIDFERLRAILAERGVAAVVTELERAECRARPVVSKALTGELKSTESHLAFHFYIGTILDGLPSVRTLREDARTALVAHVVESIRAPGAADRLWSRILPGVPEALTALRAAGLRLVIVSNADGSAERNVVARGLRDYVDAVLDSAVVGAEKPDPRIFEQALAIAGTSPARTAHVGDLYAIDVVGARAAGVHAVLLDPFDDWPDADCARFPDLRTFAEELVAARV